VPEGENEMQAWVLGKLDKNNGWRRMLVVVTGDR